MFSVFRPFHFIYWHYFIFELEVYAIDTDDGEILYGYTNCVDYADFIPVETTAGAVVEDITLIVKIGNSENVFSYRGL